MTGLSGSTAMRRHVAASVCCGAVIAATAIAGAVVLAHLIAGIITGAGPRTVEHWAGPLWLLLGVWTLRTLAVWAQARLSQRGASAVITELTQRVLTTVTALPPQRLLAVRDDAAALTTRALDGLRPYFTKYLPAVILAALITPAALIVMAYNDIQSALIVIVALPLIPLFMVLIGLLTKDRSTAALRAMTTLQSRVLDLIAGIPTLRGVGRAEAPAERVAELGEAHRRSTMGNLRIAFMSALVLELLATLGVAMVAVSVGLRLVFGHVELATALTALLLAPEAFWPLRRVGAEFHAAQDGRTAATQAFRLLESPAPLRGALPPRDASIRLAGVSVTTRDGVAPDDLTMDAEPGAVTVLTGPNGSGKSTTLEVILGLTPPSSGRAVLGGVDSDELDLDAWWQKVAWLPQRPVLLPGTVRSNLELFGPLAELDEVCRATGFDEVLASLPDGLDTLIGRGGTGLSLGQRQRLALARALGTHEPVLLLDEPTAHLDAELEARVLEAITARARAGATVLMVAHHDAAIAIADRVHELGGERLVA